MDSFSNPLSIPNSRYNELQAPGTSRYSSYGVGRSPQNIYNSSSFTTMAANGYRPADISNVSPLVRDVGQILLGEGSAFREILALEATWTSRPTAASDNPTVVLGCCSRMTISQMTSDRRTLGGAITSTACQGGRLVNHRRSRCTPQSPVRQLRIVSRTNSSI